MNSEYEKHFIDLLEINKGERILDVGAGEGRYISLVLRRGSMYVGIGLSLQMLKNAYIYLEGKENEYRRRANLILADAENLPFRDNTFEKVFCFATIFFLPNKVKAISEMKRVSRRIVLIEFRNLLSRHLPSILLRVTIFHCPTIFQLLTKTNFIRNILSRVYGKETIDRVAKDLECQLTQPYYPISSLGVIRVFHKVGMKICYVEGFGSSGFGFKSKVKWIKPILIVKVKKIVSCFCRPIALQ